MALSKQPAHPSQYLVASKNLEFGEYLFDIKLTDDETESHFCQIICALLNTSGGVIIVDLGVPLWSKRCDNWKSNLGDRLNFLPPDVYNECIALHEFNGLIYVVVHKAKEFITTNSFLFNRTPGAASVLVRHHRGISTILSQDVIKGEARIFPLSGPYSYMQSCTISEAQNLEFKFFSCRKVNELIEKLKDARVAKTIFAMGNVPGGGEIIIGIEEPYTPSTSKQTKGKQLPHNRARPTQSAQSQPQITHLKGQELLTTEEEEFVTELEKHLQNVSGNSNGIWGDPKVVPLRGTHWDCEFIPLGPPPCTCQQSCQSCPHQTRRVLIRIRIFQCPQGLYAGTPEAFTLTDDGEVIAVPFAVWQTKHGRPKQPASTVGTPPAVSPPAHVTSKMTSQTSAAQATAELAEIFEDGTKISFKEHSSRSEIPGLTQEYSDHHKETIDIFEPTAPVHFTPSENEIVKYLSLKTPNDFPQGIADELSGQEGFGIADDTLFDCFEHGVTPVSSPTAQQSTSFKPRHVMDLLVVTNIPRIFLFVICSTLDNWLIEYTMVLARILKNKLLQRMSSEADYKAMNIMCKIVSLDGSRPHCSPEYYHRWFTYSCSGNLSYIRKALASILSQTKTHFRDAIHLGADLSLSQEQIQVLLGIDTNRFNIIEGPPGCGKTLLARHVCTKYGRETSAYISSCVALNKRVGATGAVDVFYAADSSQILSLLQKELKDKTHIVIDDNHNYAYTDDRVHEICETIAKSKMVLFVFQDSRYQNYKDDAACNNLLMIMSGQNYGTVCTKTLTEIRRNSQVVGSFLKAQVSSLLYEEECNDFKCVSALKGDDIVINHIANLRAQSKENGLVKHIEQLIINPLKERSRGCAFSDIAVLIGHQEEATAVEEIRKYRELFKNVWPDCKPQGAEVYPVEGVIVDTLTNFAGLESKVVVFIMPPSTDKPETVIDTKHRIAVASRGIERVDFVREENLDLTIAKHMRCDHYPQDSLKALNESSKTEDDAVEADDSTNQSAAAAGGGSSQDAANTDTGKEENLKKPTRELRVKEEIECISVTAAGDILCCSDDSVMMYSADGARSEFHGPFPDPRSPSDPSSQPDTLRPYSVAAHGPSGDLVVGYDTRTEPHAVYLTVFSRGSNMWSPPHSLGAGRLPCVAWTQAERVAVGVRGTLVLYDPTRHAEVWRRTVGVGITDVAVCGERICCCLLFTASISVYGQDGARSRTLGLQAPGRQFLFPVSVCEGGGGQLLVLHQEKVDGRYTGLVTAWTGDGEYVRDVVPMLPGPSHWDCVRSHGATLYVLVREERRILCYRLRP